MEAFLNAINFNLVINFLGSAYKFVALAVGFMILDFFTGWIQAKKNGTFKSSVMRAGGKKKLYQLITIPYGMLLDAFFYVLSMPISFNIYGMTVNITVMISVYLIAMEIDSCMENIGKIDKRLIPKRLRDTLDALKGELDEKEEN